MKIFEMLRAVRDLHVPAAHKAILYALVLRTDSQTGECRPSYPTLAADAGVSLALANRAVKELERAGHISVNRRDVDGTRWSQVNRYIVLVRHDIASTRDDVVSPKHDVVSERAGIMSPGHDVVSPGDDVVHGDPDDPVVRDGRGETSASKQHNGLPERTTDSPFDVVSSGDHVVSERHDGRVSATTGGRIHATRGSCRPDTRSPQ